uniref:CDP-alcohol phosphatidyltransferase family protein n=1 Tax=Flavobacterium sp. TaxID=239 RepID=UPI00404A4DE2
MIQFIKKQIPNLFTLLNLFSGCIALYFCTINQFEWVFAFVCLGIFFDFFDGFFARLFNVAGPLGLQLDSLADMVTSGVVPGFVMFYLLSETSENQYLPFFGFVIILASAYRLAKFNIDTRQTNSFIGLPTPANALLITSLPLVFLTDNFLKTVLFNEYGLVILTAVSAFLLNAEIPLFSLKVKKFTFKSNEIQVIFLLISIVLAILFKIIAVPLIILFYVFMSILHPFFVKRST